MPEPGGRPLSTLLSPWFGVLTIVVVQLTTSSSQSIDENSINDSNKYTNPVVDEDHPDPGVLAVPEYGGFVVVSTTSSHRNNDDDPFVPVFPLMFSTDLVTWNHTTYVFEADSWPRWARSNMWAPEIHLVNGRYLVYFSAQRRADKRYCIGVAISTDPTNPFGPYKDLGRPLVDDPEGQIDVTWFKDPKDGAAYLLWRDMQILGGSSIVCRPVEDDGITFRDEWPAKKLINSNLLNDFWCIEGPWMIYRDPYYYLLFSAKWYFIADYHTKVARSLSIEGPFVRNEGLPFSHMDYDRYNNNVNCTFVGPGHGSTVRTATREDWFVYHGWKYGQVQEPPGRVLLLDQIKWSDDGWPYVGYPSDVPTEKPSIPAWKEEI